MVYYRYFFFVFLGFISIEAREFSVGKGYSIILPSDTKFEILENKHDFQDTDVHLDDIDFKIYVGDNPWLENGPSCLEVDVDTRYDIPLFIYRFKKSDSHQDYDLWLVGVLFSPDRRYPCYFHVRANNISRDKEHKLIDALRSIRRNE